MEPRRLIVEVDTRENCPIPFPQALRVPRLGLPDAMWPVEVHRVKLDAGDYRLADAPGVCVIERKGSQLELYKNLFDPRDQVRQAASFKKLSESARFPYLMIEARLPDVMTKRPAEPRIERPELVLYKISRAIEVFGLRLLWISSSSASVRRNIGELMLYIMTSHAYTNEDFPSAFSKISVDNPRRGCQDGGSSVVNVKP
jgi:hypothetical protein